MCKYIRLKNRPVLAHNGEIRTRFGLFDVGDDSLWCSSELEMDAV